MKQVMEDKRKLIAEKTSEFSCMSVLVTLTILLLCAMTGMATLTFLDLNNLEQRDAILRADIAKMLSQLENTRMSGDENEADAQVVSKLEKKRELVNRQTNLFEEILSAQRSVFEKFCHEKNATCPKGVTGVKGQQGEMGLDGKPGARGSLGQQGQLGDAGAAGTNGTSGDTGAIGKTGNIGPVGPLGAKGPIGNNGLNGTSGDIGNRGLKGIQGDIGDDGAVGPPGTAGLPGSKGPVGVMGDAGPQGLNGTQGSMGPKGADVRKLPVGCECLKKPTFRRAENEIINIVSRGRRDLPCEATGNPRPEVTITRANGAHQKLAEPEVEVTGSYQCLATNQYGSAYKQVTVVRI